MRRMMTRRLGSAVSSVTALIVLAGFGQAPAAAATMEVPAALSSDVPSISEHDYALAFSQFESTGVARDIVLVNGVRTVTFHLVDGYSLTMVDPETVSSSTTRGGVRPDLSAGFTQAGYYVGFNQFDQNTLSNAFLAAGLTAAICAIPGVGQVACVIAGVAVSVGVAYINRNGICSNNRTLYWWDAVDRNGARGSTIACRSSVPK